MGLVDTIMVGRVSPVAIGAVNIGGTIFATVALFAGGILLGLDTLVSQSFGGDDLRDCHRSLLNALYLCVPLAPAVMVVSLWIGPGLAAFGVNAEVAAKANEYLNAVTWGALPLLVYFAMRRYLQAMHLVKPVMFALVSANLVHILANWILIFGHWGSPALGSTGAGWATCFSRSYMAAYLVVYALWHERQHNTGWREMSLMPDFARMRRLLSLGIPAGTQIALEIGVFSVVGALAGRLRPAELAAHQIAMNCATVTFMVPFGIGSAAAVRVGNAIGRGRLQDARAVGWAAIFVGGVFMSVMSLILVAVPRPILRIFTSDPTVIEAGVSLLVVAGIFQLFDGIQAVATGSLRGLGDTNTPLICSLVGYWLVGLPLGYWLCFSEKQRVEGLWLGLCAALMIVASALLITWSRQTWSSNRDRFARP